MDNADREHDRTGDENPPQAIAGAVHDVGEQSE
jgi:hypothetical protein